MVDKFRDGRTSHNTLELEHDNYSSFIGGSLVEGDMMTVQELQAEADAAGLAKEVTVENITAAQFERVFQASEPEQAK